MLKIQKIIVFCLAPLGDTLFAIPALRALREAYPRAKIVIVVSLLAREVFKNSPFNLELIICHKKWNIFRILSNIRREKYDLALGLSKFGSIFTRFCGIPHWSDLFLLGIKQPKVSVVEFCLGVVRRLGIPTADNQQTEFWIRDDQKRAVEEFLAQRKILNNSLVGVHCGGHYFARKRWPLQYFIEMSRALHQLGFQVILVGGKEDQERAFTISSAVPEVLSTVGLFNLEETGALLQKCLLFIGNDSGPLHLAAALKVPTLGLFGPTSPEQFYPYTTSRHQFIRKSIGCNPCYFFGNNLVQYLPKCREARCMEAIKPEEVIRQIEDYFKSSKKLKVRS